MNGLDIALDIGVAPVRGGGGVWAGGLLRGRGMTSIRGLAPKLRDAAPGAATSAGRAP